MILVIYVLNKVKYKILFKSWKKNTFKPYKPLCQNLEIKPF